MLLRPVVYGVEAMHRMGLLHRGISPETVFITPTRARQAVRLCHAGPAHRGRRAEDASCADGYAAPEQYAVAEFDGKYTDIYSLGRAVLPRAHGHRRRWAGQPAPHERQHAAAPTR